MTITDDIHLREKIDLLTQSISRKGNILVAFSGGVDSSVVAAAVERALGDRALAVIIGSPLHPSSELEEARRTAEHIGINSLVVQLNELEIPGFCGNPPSRCYLCQSFRIRKLKEIAIERHFETVADGTNASDLNEYRPGLKAKEELGMYCPLVEAGLSKDATRNIAELLGLPIANKAASPCLATRFPYDHELTPERLMRIETAESWIRDVTGVKILRVRELDRSARIEVGPEERELFFNGSLLDEVARKLKGLGYDFVTLDVEGYKSGSFDRG
ncbi:ATP-dependent sacrificial sulfur transferase LarE [Chloroflexota bacterium]